MSVSARVEAVRRRLAAAAERSGRDPQSITLVAVTKYAAPDDGMVEALLEAGCRDFGESRVQSLLEKVGHFAQTNDVRPYWHLIGTLQRNKVRKILPHVTLIHSIDSLSLAEAIDRIAVEEGIETVRGLLEVNISGEANKHGFRGGELPEALERLGELSRLRIEGLMGMAGLDSDAERTRGEFAALRRLAANLASHLEQNPPQRRNIRMRELSMGMSDDFEAAVEEGATIVRIGSILYDDFAIPMEI